MFHEYRVLLGIFLIGTFGCANMSVKKLEFKNPPSLGRSSAGQEIFLGGFSGLHFLGKTPQGRHRFITHTDRGPNGEMYNGNRPFLLPDFTPRWIIFSLDQDFKDLVLEKTILLQSPEGNLSGLPPVVGLEDPVDVYDYLLPPNTNGIDPEGLTQDQKGHFWMGEEYLPSLLEFSPEGMLLNRFTAGKHFPELFAKRRLNRGFEGITFFKNNIWAFLESPLKAGPGDLQGPILIFNPNTQKPVEVKYYPFDNSTADKIGDVATLKIAGEELGLLVLERNNVLGKDGYRKIYFIPDPSQSGPLKKRLVADLIKIGIDNVEKIEGMTVVDGRYLILINDNDFALRGHPDYLKTGLVPTKDEGSYIYVIDLNSLLPKTWSWAHE